MELMTCAMFQMPTPSLHSVTTVPAKCSLFVPFAHTNSSKYSFFSSRYITLDFEFVITTSYQNFMQLIRNFVSYLFHGTDKRKKKHLVCLMCSEHLKTSTLMHSVKRQHCTCVYTPRPSHKQIWFYIGTYGNSNAAFSAH